MYEFAHLHALKDNPSNAILQGLFLQRWAKFSCKSLLFFQSFDKLNGEIMASKRTFQISSAVLALLFVSYVGWSLIVPDKSDSHAGEELAAPDIGAGAPIPVQVARAERRDLIVRVSTNGTTRAARQLKITADIGGEIDSVGVAEGQYVQKGALLFSLDDRDFRLKVREAEEQVFIATLEYDNRLRERRNSIQSLDTLSRDADIGILEREYDEAKARYSRGEISKQKLVLIERELAAAKILRNRDSRRLIASRTNLNPALIALDRAKLELERTRVRAPFSGFVGNIKIEPGMNISAGAECMTLIDLDRLLVDVDILESEMPLVQVGEKAVVMFTAFPGERFSGKVVSLNPLMDPEKNTRRATVMLANPQHKLIAGMHATVKLDAQIFKDRLLVPKAAVVLRDQRPVVFIARKDAEGQLRAVWSYVEIGRQNEQFVEILSSKFDLKEGERVITSNHYTMIHDARIKIVQ